MPHLQINFAVHDLVAGVRFYSAMFARDPAELKPDYAKWMIDDPRVSFTIFAHDALPRTINLSGQCPNARPLTNGSLANTHDLASEAKLLTDWERNESRSIWRYRSVRLARRASLPRRP